MMGELMQRIEQLEDKVNQMVRLATVTNCYPESGTVRVQIKDADDLVSYKLQVLYPKTGQDKYYHMPDVGEQVVCVFLPLGLEQGFVIGALYSTADPVPVSDQDKHHIKFSDGTSIEYDRNRSALTVDCVNEVLIRSAVRIQAQAARIDWN